MHNAVASHRATPVDTTLDDLDRAIINTLQREFPLVSEPFGQVASELGTEKSVLIARIQNLLDAGVLTRFGPLFNAERLGGALSLCAMQVPSDRFNDVSEIVNSFSEVAHNYERDHELNMWFVLATDSETSKVRTLKRIEQATHITVIDMPKQREFFVGLHFEV